MDGRLSTSIGAVRESTLQKAWARRALPTSPSAISHRHGGCLLLSLLPIQCEFLLQQPSPFSPAQFYVVFGIRETSHLLPATISDLQWTVVSLSLCDSVRLETGKCPMWNEWEKKRGCRNSTENNNTLKCNPTICHMELEPFTLVLSNLKSIILAVQS